MTILSALDYDTLDDLVLNFKNNRKPFYFEAPAADGVAVVVNWEDEDLVDESTQDVTIHVDPEEVEVTYIGPAYDRRDLDLMGELFEDLDDEIGTLMDKHFRHSIHDRQTGRFRFVPEWSNDGDHAHHVYAAEVPIRREPVTRV